MVPSQTLVTHHSSLLTHHSPLITAFQNLKRIVVCTLRMALAAAGSPNCALLIVEFQPVKVGWLRKFVESIRKSRLSRSRRRKVRPIEAFSAN